VNVVNKLLNLLRNSVNTLGCVRWRGWQWPLGRRQTENSPNCHQIFIILAGKCVKVAGIQFLGGNMADETKNAKPGFFTKTISTVKSFFVTVGDTEWKIPEVLLGKAPTDKLAQSVEALSKGHVAESYQRADEAKDVFLKTVGPEGAVAGAFGPGGAIFGSMLHRATGSADIKPPTPAELAKMTFSDAAARDAQTIKAAFSNDMAKVREWIGGGHDAKESPAQTIPTAKPPAKNSETNR
jgi:hypothetical protein